MTELLDRRSPEEAEHRLNVVVGLLQVLRSGDETATLRAMEAAAKIVEDAPDDADEMREALAALRTEDELVLQEMRSAGGGGVGTVAADQPSVGAALSARGQARPKGRTGKVKAAPGEPGSSEFERQHPRGRGGKWIQKGEGMQEQPSDRVKQMQARLHQLGFTVDADGRFGIHTEEAVKAFQRKYGLKETGKVDAATVETMRNPPPVTAAAATAQIKEETDPTKKGSSSSRSGKTGGGSRSGRSRSRPSSGSQITLGKNDKAGIEKFQRDHGLKVTGKLDDATKGAVSALNASSKRDSTRGGRGSGDGKKGGGSGLVRRGDGMTGQPDKGVSKLQEQLDTLGFELGDGGVDGRFGEDTERAVRMLQRRYGLRVDGVVGPQTAKMIQRLIQRQKKEAKDQGYLSADQQEGVSGRSRKAQESAALHTEEETMNDEVQEARNIGGVANNAPGTVAGTTQAFGGWPGTVAQEQSNEKSSLPFTHAPEDDVLFGHDPPVMPPNLRPAPSWQFARCASCVHHDAKRLCMLYSAGTGLDDLCDSWYSLTPEDARGRIVGVLTARSELTTARESADGGEIVRAKAHLDQAMQLLEASSVDDPEFHEVVHGLVEKGRPRAEAKEQAKTLIAKKRLHQFDQGVVALTLIEAEEHHKLKCPKCDHVQAASNKVCEKCGHNLAEARKAKFAALRESAEQFGAEDFAGAYWLNEATFTGEQREKLAKKGQAMGHGGYPIRNESDLKNAIQAFGRAKNKAATKRHIIKRARALGKTDLLPDGWLQEATVSLSAPKLVEVKSSAYPDLDRSPKKNWVEKAGGLPKYIERIAKHLHYEKGMQIGRAIATAVNVVKKMCASGDVNFPGKQNVNAGSRAEACAAVASWEKKKAGAKLKEALELVEAAEQEEGRAPYLSLQECVEIVEALELHEARYPLNVHFDPHLHPRNRVGKFRDVLRAIERAGKGAEVTMPGGVSVRRRAGGAFTVHQAGKRKSGNFNIDKTARSALKLSGFETEDDRSAIPFGLRGERYNVAAVALDPGEKRLFVGAYVHNDRSYRVHRIKGTRTHVASVEGQDVGTGSKNEVVKAAKEHIEGRKGGGAVATRGTRSSSGAPGEGVSDRYKAEHAEGLDDARAERPRRLGQTAGYRAGYDKGISEPLAASRGMTVTMGDRPQEFTPGDRVVLADGREGIVGRKSRGGTSAFSGEFVEPEYAVSVRKGEFGNESYGMVQNVKHSQLSFHPDEIATRREGAEKLRARAEKPPARRAVKEGPAGVTNTASAVPAEWQVERGYAEWQNPTYTNPREGERVHVMPSSSAYSDLAGKTGTVVKDAYSSRSSTLIDVRFDDGETKSISNQVLMREGDKQWARLKPGTDVEKMLYHYLAGKKPPANFPAGSAAAQQFSYTGKGKKDERIALIRKLTGATLKEMATVLGWTPLARHEALDDLALVESTSLASVRLPVAELLLEARQVKGNLLVEAVSFVLRDRLRNLVPELPVRLQEARERRREAVGDAPALARADGIVKLYETLETVLS